MRTNLNLAVLLVLAACGSGRLPSAPREPPPMVKLSCTPQDCDGCCLDGVCNRIPSASFCGGGGAACFACPSGTTCGAERRCETIADGQPVEAATCTLTFQPIDVEPARPLVAVWATPGGAWAVGPEGAVAHDPSSNRLVAPANDAAIGKNLRAVWAVGDDAKTAWIIRSGVAAAIHHEGPGVSSDEPSPFGLELYAVWGRGDREVYVGGGAPGNGHIAKWDGTAWRDAVVASEPIIALSGWGKLGAFALTATELFVEKNGVFVNEGAAPGPLSGGLHVVGAREAWLAGSDGRAHHWEDGKWTSQNVGATALGGIWGPRKNLLFFTEPDANVTVFDGNHKASLDLVGNLSAIAGTTSSRAIAVGSDGAVLARCATPKELEQSTGMGGPPVWASSGSSGSQYCVTNCVDYSQWGCAGYTTTCF